MRPLEGLVVLDFSTLLPGPLAALLLVEAGAEVVKIERPGSGDEMRLFEPRVDGESLLFALLNRGKQSLSLDLKSAADRARLQPYLDKADILIEQFRPGVMAKLGLGFETLSALNPGLIYCSITGYGQNGPKAQLAGHDLNYIADTGLLALSSGPDDRPVVPPALMADIAGGAYPAFMNILLALESRRRNGAGLHLDISMTDNLFPLAWSAFGHQAARGTPPGNGADLLTGGTARYHLYPTRDGRIVAAAPIEDRFWASFCDVLDLAPELRDDRHRPEATLAAVTAIIAAQSASHWAEKFSGVDCCCSIVRDLDAALADPHFQARGIQRFKMKDAAGRVWPALPLPLVPAFRGSPEEILPSPPLE
jgi:crotonobetainyl-CoA:carnitine CoA-transferase CaiB-like acyl-CoA transferase